MPERIAKVSHEYAGRWLKPGEAFEVEPQHVPLWLTLGRIEPQEGEPGYVARELSADEPAGYLTRDMRGERRTYKRKASTQ